jgi:xanthosine utilization system XapX-like protein
MAQSLLREIRVSVAESSSKSFATEFTEFTETKRHRGSGKYSLETSPAPLLLGARYALWQILLQRPSPAPPLLGVLGALRGSISVWAKMANHGDTENTEMEWVDRHNYLHLIPWIKKGFIVN